MRRVSQRNAQYRKCPRLGNGLTISARGGEGWWTFLGRHYSLCFFSTCYSVDGQKSCVGFRFCVMEHWVEASDLFGRNRRDGELVKLFQLRCCFLHGLFHDGALHVEQETMVNEEEALLVESGEAVLRKGNIRGVTLCL